MRDFALEFQRFEDTGNFFGGEIEAKPTFDISRGDFNNWVRVSDDSTRPLIRCYIPSHATSIAAESSASYPPFERDIGRIRTNRACQHGRSVRG
jgi:hypothetical protein